MLLVVIVAMFFALSAAVFMYTVALLFLWITFFQIATNENEPSALKDQHLDEIELTSENLV